MTGMIVLDVVIGLIFIYLFYSLFCTVIVEIIATNLGLRARNLKIAIIRMLSDDSHSVSDTIRAFWSSDSFPGNSTLAKDFYASPLIKFLGFSDWFKKPAWIGNEIFIDGIISILSNSNSKTYHLQKKLKNFLRLLPAR